MNKNRKHNLLAHAAPLAFVLASTGLLVAQEVSAPPTHKGGSISASAQMPRKVELSDTQADKPKHSKVSLADYPTQPYTVQPGDGLDTAIFSVDPKVEDLPQTKLDLEHFLAKRALSADGNLPRGEVVQVPDLSRPPVTTHSAQQ